MFGRRKDPPQSKVPDAVILKCSFCNKSQRDVKKLIAGPNVQICDECVDICLDIVSEEKKDRSSPSAVEGSGGTRPLQGTLLFCGLCRMPTTLDQSLAVPDRGIICGGCVGAFEAALADRNEH